MAIYFCPEKKHSISSNINSIPNYETELIPYCLLTHLQTIIRKETSLS